MKELSIEEKAKRYDEAYKVAKNIHIFSSDLAEIKRMEEIFPELKEESEDERIRKKICKLLWDNAPYEEAQEYIAWLEKQGEQKPADVEEVNFFDDFRKTDSEVEPKFKVGDWITDGYLHYKITDVLEDRYIVDTKYVKRSAILFDNESCYHLWTIQDAKAGDILVCGKDKRPFIFKDLLDKFHPNNPVAYCGIDCSNEFFISIGTIWWTDEEVEPATKEQRDLLFQKMKDTGYEWDAEKKELKKIKQKPAWSKEDEVKINRIVACLENLNVADNDILLKDVDWLKSLKDRVGCEVNCTTTKEWKPSDEQIDELRKYSDNVVLRNLYYNLKKLKVE